MISSDRVYSNVGIRKFFLYYLLQLNLPSRWDLGKSTSSSVNIQQNNRVGAVA